MARVDFAVSRCAVDKTLVEFKLGSKSHLKRNLRRRSRSTSRRIRIIVLREGLAVALLGGLVGLAGAYGATQMLTNLLYGTAPADPASFAVAAVGVIAVGFVASYIPAARAAGADPLVALRAD